MCTSENGYGIAVKEGKKKKHNWCLFAYLKCQNQFAILSPSGCAKLILTTSRTLLSARIRTSTQCVSPVLASTPRAVTGCPKKLGAKQSGSVTLRM